MWKTTVFLAGVLILLAGAGYAASDCGMGCCPDCEPSMSCSPEDSPQGLLMDANRIRSDAMEIMQIERFAEEADVTEEPAESPDPFLSDQPLTTLLQTFLI